MAGTVLLMTLFIVTANIGLDVLVRGTYHEDQVLMGMEITDQSPAKVWLSPAKPDRCSS